MTDTEKIIASLPRGCFVDGSWSEGAQGKTFPVEDPATGGTICTVSDTTGEDWSAALEAAVAADEHWRRVSIQYRSDLLRRVYEQCLQREEEFATIVSLETGKPYKESVAEIRYGASFLRWYSELIMTQRGETGAAPSGEYQMVTIREPVGPSLLITPWNFPFAMVTRKVGAAVAAGCTSIIKPAFSTPLTCALLVETFRSCGLPDGVLNYLPTGDPRNLSVELMADFRLRKISFTGSTQVGSTLLRQAANNIQTSSMELGGNAPFLVLPDADLEAAIDGAIVAKFRNAGQACVGANRIIAHTEVYDEFLDGFLDRVRTLKVGAWDESPDVGPLIDTGQRRRVDELVRKAETEGAEVMWGGSEIEGSGAFYQPTVVTGAPVGGTLWKEEIFGPVAAVYRADSVDEMLRMANDTEYGLVSYVYGSDSNVLNRFTTGIQSGMVAVNRPIISEARSPFGGVKASGLGREGGLVGLDDYQVVKYIAVEKRS